MRALITGGGGQLGRDLDRAAWARHETLALTHAELDITDSARARRAPSRSSQPDVVFNCAAFHNVEVCETEPDAGLGRSTSRAVRDLARQRRAARPPLDQLRLRRSPRGALRRGRPARPALDLRADQAGGRVRRARLRRRGAGGPHRRPLRAARQRLEGRQLRAADDRPGPGAGRAEDGRRPAPAADLHRRPRRGDCSTAVEAGADGRPAPDRGRRLLVVRVHRGDHASWPGSTCRSSRCRRRSPRAAPTGR